MLSRTAESLFWLTRYIERAENVARILTVGHRTATIAHSLGNLGNEWESTLRAAGCEDGFFERFEAATSATVIAYMVFDADNPSSIYSCLEAARRNGRAVRTALTVDMWEALNQTWQQLRTLDQTSTLEHSLIDFLDWVKERSLFFNGAYTNTMLRNDAFFFTRLGTFLERADNTARLLDVKYHILLPRDEEVGGALDYYQWQAILRSVSALRSYHWIYHDRLKPWLIAELLLLRPEMPRSLRASLEQIARHLDLLADAYGGRRGECHRLAGEMYARLRFGRIEDIFPAGLHEFLGAFLTQTAQLSNEINVFYLK
jgi:uncharacterized alpha-E superfamily protein